MLDDVQVHYNSSKPAQFQTLVYTDGTSLKPPKLPGNAASLTRRVLG